MRMTTRAAVAMVSIIATLAVAGPVHAAEPARYCTVNLKSHTAACFRTHDAAIAVATGGKLTSIRGLSHRQLVERLNQIGAAADEENKTARALGLQPQGAVTIAIEYEHTGYTGEPWYFYADAKCDNDGTYNPDYWYHYVDIDNPGSNDKISSFELFADCEQRSYEHAGWGGRDLWWRTNEPNLVRLNFNDMISSLRFT